VDQKDKEYLEDKIKMFNDRLSKYEMNDYLSKKHLLDYVDNFLSELVDEFDLNIEP